MHNYKGLFLSVLCLCVVVACSSAPLAQTPLTTLQGTQGGTIIYGRVDGATNPAMAMASLLRTVQNSCGDKPQVGRVFRVRGSNSDAVFFTVTNHAEENVPVAGMVIATQTGPKSVEAALVSDAASRFGTTVNSLLNQLFDVWHPGGAAATPTAKSSTSAAAPTSGATAAALPPMHQFTLSDGTASAEFPNGWQVQPGGHLGTIGFIGPHQEFIVLNAIMQAQDPRAPAFQTAARMRIQPQPSTLVLPYDTDWVKAFPNVYLTFAHVLKWNSTNLTLDHTELLPATGSQRCVQGNGHVNNGSGLMELNAMFCPEQPEQPQTGLYLIFEFIALVPNAYADQERAIVAAVFGSYRWDEAKAKSLAYSQAAPIIAQMQQTYQAHQQALMSFTQQQIARTQQIGAQAKAQMNATEAANQAQWAGFDQQENNISRQGQGFSNYLLDQTVIQDNNMYGNGTVGHATVWNSTADALVKSNPNRYEYVNTPNYWKGTDYVP